MSKKIVITNEKGGTGKSTITCLLVDYLNYQQKPVQLIDTDIIRTSQKWANNCQIMGRQVSQELAEYEIIDTAGTSGASMSWLKEADLIVIPFQSHYADLTVTVDWFTSLKENWQKKIIFIPNRWQDTLEQREGLKQLEQIVAEEQAGKILSPIKNRPAIFAKFLNGSEDNFFASKNVPSGLEEIMHQIISHVTN
ncbi:MAG: Iron-sulfur cluster carrier protein [Mycoplasmataceae bacterium]|nr:MAG: Iron-sulfur cluster carrier protein [Mycoplasmataceae bacterium]